MRLFAKVLLHALLILVCSNSLLARAEDKNKRALSDYSIEELLNVPLSVASTMAATPRESPAVVTLVTGEEIRNSGARDLIDVLRLIPGFEFGSDVEGVVGLGFRGNWGHEGKILLLVDDHEINETMFSNIAFGNHFSMDQIDHIEIIRGPGSALYGGFAELAVIKIITKVGSELEGLEASYASGYMQGDYARQNMQLSAGKHVTDDFYFGASGFLGYANRSDLITTDFSGTTYDLSDNASLDPIDLNLRARYRDLTLSFMYDDYRTTDRYPNDVVAPNQYGVIFTSYLFRAIYAAHLTEALRIEPELRYKSQKPWHNAPPPAPTLVTPYEARADRYNAILRGVYEPNSQFSGMLGIEMDYDVADYSSTTPLTFSGGAKSVDYYNYTAFGEASVRTNVANVTAGIRLEDHDQFGSSLVPRLGLTKVFGDFHAKLLYNRAFRAPGIENIHGGVGVKPERTETYEIEMGYRFTENTLLTANVFDTHISRPIIFVFDTATNQDTYVNQPEVGTRGFEIEYRNKYAIGYANLTYSFYVVSENKVPQYAVPGDRDQLLAFPQHKVTLNGNLKVNERFSLNPSFIWTSERYGYDFDPASSGKSLQEFDPELIANLYLLYRDAFTPGLDVGFGVFDIFGANHAFVQPYDGDHAPLPGPSREFFTKISYRWQ